ncbi:bZIP transcription factor 16-like protein [Drosera capensis]
MGGSETDKAAAKETKGTPPSAAQEQSSGTSMGTVNPEWPGYQGYAPIPPHGYIASSPQAHPYMWGVQHIMPPYGTPPHPYMAMYPHGVYAHPSIPAGNTPGNADADGKLPEGKEKLPIKRSKGSLGSLNMITGKTNDQGKTTGPSANGTLVRVAVMARVKEDSPSNLADGTHNGSSVQGSQNGLPNASRSLGNPAMSLVPMTTAPAHGAVAGPTTNLNIGMDYWGTPAPSAIPAMRGKVSSAAVGSGIMTVGSHDNMQSQLWLQAECDELAQRAESLKEENASLRAELERIRREHDQLVAENTNLKERLGETPEDSATGKAEQNSVNDQSNEAEHGIEPQVEHYGCIVGLLGRARLFEKALKWIEEMPMKHNYIVWRSLLSAAKLHHDLESAEIAARKLDELGLLDGGLYVVLANMYARDKRWDKVETVRTMMASKGLAQVPGFCFGEVQGTLHKFHWHDKTHPGCDEIYEMMHQMEWQLKFEGYSPDTSETQINFSEEEKRQRLKHHCQKLAMAYTLLYTPKDTTIRITRNLSASSNENTTV